MPLVRKYANATSPAATPQPPEDTGTFGKLRSALGMGTRLVGGFLGNVGGLPGAAIGAGTEGLAEGIEGSLDWGTSPARIATEAAISAVPLGKTLTAGRAVMSAGKGMAFNAAGDVGRQWAEGNFDAKDNQPAPGLDYKRTGFAALMGALTNGVLGHLSPNLEGAPKAAALDAVDNSGKRLPRANQAVATGVGPQPYTNIGDQTHGPLPAEASLAPQRVPFGGPTAVSREGQSPSFVRSQEASARIAARDQQAGVTAADRASRQRDAYEKEIRTAYDQASQEDRLRELKATLTADGGVTPTTNYSERLSGYSADGTPASASIKYLDDADEAAAGGNRPRANGTREGGVPLDPQRDEIIQRGMRQPEGSMNRMFAEWLASDPNLSIADAMRYTEKGVRPAPAARVAQITGGVVPEAGAAESAAVNHVPTAPPAVVDDLIDNPGGSAPRVDRVHPEDGLTDGPWVDEQNALADWYAAPINDMVPSRFDTPPELPPVPPTAPPAPPRGRGARAKAARNPVAPASGEDAGLQDLLDYLGIDQAYREADPAGRKELGKIFGRSEAQAGASNGGLPPKGKPVGDAVTGSNPLDIRSNKGLSETEALLSTALGVGGGLAGYATDRSNGDDSGIDGALLGAGAGFAAGMGATHIPKLLASVNLPDTILATPQGRRTAAEEIYNAIPQFQRFAYLSDLRGLPGNAVAGPYGSMITGAIEAGLSGDPRGWTLLKHAWNPANFLKEWTNSAPEAMSRLKQGELGRLEGLDFNVPDKLIPRSFGEASTAARFGMSAPGIAMTQGDVAARKFLMDAGFTEAEAQKMTLTSEPATALGHELAGVGKQSTLANILFPFRRTPLNIMEQGAERLPGLGPIVDYMNGATPTVRETLAKQAGGVASSVAGYGIGTEMDDPKSNWQNMGRRSFTNAMGRYSLPATLGMFLGQTVGQGKKLNKQNFENISEQSVPLPGVDSVVDLMSYLAGKGGLTSNPDPKLPRGLQPFRPFTDRPDAPPLGKSSRIRKR